MSNELVALSPEQYPALMPEAPVIIRENLAGEEVSPQDLTRIRIPAGGATAWTVPTADGEQSFKEIEGVIVHIGRRRAYWSDPNPTGQMPDCTSNDCIRGAGNPGGACAHCPLNVFGSARKPDGSPARGKACKESKLIFMLREGSLLPHVVVLSPASIRPMTRYQLNLGLPFWSVVTKLELGRTKNRDGIAYAEVRATKTGILPKETAQQVLAYAQQLQAVFASTTMERSDVESPDTEEV